MTVVHVAPSERDARPGDGPRAIYPEWQRMVTLGEVTYLFMGSSFHKLRPFEQIAAAVMTPLSIGQCRVYRSTRGPVGFVSWALLTQDGAEGYIRQPERLSPDAWRTGNSMWIIDFVAPFGHARQIVADLRGSVFPGRHAFALGRTRDGRLSKRVVRLRGSGAPMTSSGSGAVDEYFPGDL